MTSELLTQADNSVDFVIADLNVALRTASPVEAIILLDLIEQAAILQRKIGQLQNAIESK